MLSSISPVGEASRRQRWWLTASAHLAGAVVGGALMGAVLGGLGAAVAWAVGWPSPRAVLVALAGLALVGALVDLVPSAPAPPSWRRQVDERWLTTYRGWVYGAGYGLQLGVGVATIIPTAATYLVGAAALATASPVGGLLIGATFGALRSLPLLLTVRVRTPAALTRLMQRMSGAARPVHVAAGAGQGMLAVAALAVAVA